MENLEKNLNTQPEDPLFEKAFEIILKTGDISYSQLQKGLEISYVRAICYKFWL